MNASPWVQLWNPSDIHERFDYWQQLPPEDRALPGPLPTATQFKDLIKTYRWNTAVGADHWQPRTLGLLPDRLIVWLLASGNFIASRGDAQATGPLIDCAHPEAGRGRATHRRFSNGFEGNRPVVPVALRGRLA